MTKYLAIGMICLFALFSLRASLIKDIKSSRLEILLLGRTLQIAASKHLINPVAPAKKITGKPAVKAKADQVIIIKPIVNAMKFDQKAFTVKAGTTVDLVFNNIDFMQHNLLILKKGSMDKVGAAADEMAQDPKGAAVQYVPKMPEVLFYTPLLNPEAKFTLRFKVPDVLGDYPYICSFPGHWRIMNGVMKVIK